MRRPAPLLWLVMVGCSPTLPWLHGEIVNHPAVLVGEWVDVTKTIPTDSSVWILSSDGYDGGLRITRDPARGGAARVARERYGYWYVRTRDGHQELCVTRRPGRDAPSCTPFETAIDSGATPPRRRLRLTAYTGTHHTGERILVERPER